MGLRTLSAVAIMIAGVTSGALLRAQGPPPPPPPPPPPMIVGIDQTPREGTGLIVGRVVDGGSGRGVPAAIVSVTGSGVSPATGGLRVLTDNDGQFVFRNLPSGTLNLSVTKGGYLPGAYGRRTPNGAATPLELADGQRLGDVSLVVWKTAAITGTIVDELGEPAVRIEVHAYRRTFVSGRRGLRQEGSATTDDRGVYRMYSLTPGQFIVAVVSTTVAVPADVAAASQSSVNANAPDREAIMREMSGIGAFNGLSSSAARIGNMVQNVSGSLAVPPSKGGRFAYPTTFYPSANASAQASAITLASGQERTGIDIQLRPVPAVTVSGSVIGPEGPVSTVGLRLIPSSAEVLAAEVETSSTISDRSGGFTFLGVTPGQYTLRVVKQPPPVRTERNTTSTTVQMGGGVTISTVTTMAAAPDVPLPEGPTLWESMPLSVGGTDLANVTVSLRSGARISGRVEFDGAARVPEAADLQRISIMLQPASGQMTRPGASLRGRVEADLRFATVGLPGDRYFLRVGGDPQGWTFKSAIHEGRDLADVPFDASGGDITGVVISFTDRPTELNGTVTGAAGADPDATVLIFPSDANAWTEWGINSRRIRAVRTSAAGAYTTKGLPAGEYNVVAVPDALAVDWQEPSMLEALSRAAVQIRIDEGEKKTQPLRTARGVK